MLRPLLIALAASLAVSACESRNVQTDLEIVDVRTGWYDVGITDTGENKIVPSISLRLRNVSEKPISGVQLDAVFKNVGQEEIIDDYFVPGVAYDASLEAGERTSPIVMRSEYGYTSPAARQDMFEHSQFIDVRVRILGRHGRNNWAPMGEFDIARELLTD